jgi:steroid delta-isomerase-like uncharacterized protein
MTAPGSNETDLNKANIRRAIDEIWNRGNWEASEELWARDIVLHLPTEPEPLEREAIKSLFEQLHTAFPDLTITIDDLVAENDRVAARWTLRGTHEGDYFGFPRTGNPVTVQELAILRCADGKAEEIWLMPNILGSMQQLGLGQPPRPVLRLVALIQRIRGRRRRRRG